MPGRRLNELERKLEGVWDKGATSLVYPFLRSISVSADPPGLRGIQSLSVNIEYPVTVISGPNGSGKTTLLNLCALAFHGVPGHEPRGSRQLSKKKEKHGAYYTFQDFFFLGPGDSMVGRVEISWNYSNGQSLVVRKQSAKWMRYERRPPRPVEFIGISRAVPAIEQNALRTHFPERKTISSSPLSEQGVRWVSQVLQREYSVAESLESKRYALRRCRTSQATSYSSFNMGAGEDVAIEIISAIDRLPIGSLVVIEEVEIGLHAAALRRLATVLLEAAKKKQLQIIVSSHSEHFVDALPRRARILMQSRGGHVALNEPSSRYVFSSLDNVVCPELQILCEDEFARMLIREAIGGGLARRVAITAVGSVETIARVAAGFLRVNEKANVLVVWDGDVTEERAEFVERKSRNECGLSREIPYAMLPGPAAPELLVAQAVRTSESACAALARELRESSPQDLKSLLEEASCESDHHSIPKFLASRLGRTQQEVVSAMARVFCEEFSALMAPLVGQVSRSL